MITRYIAPAQVRFGPGALNAALTQGSRALVIGESWLLQRLQGPLEALFKRHTVVAPPFGGECTREEIRLWVARGQGADGGQEPQAPADVVVGVGGGRALDTAKAAAFHLRCPIVTIPTSAATCAAWTALSAVNSSEGIPQEYLLLDRAPDVVIIDPACFVGEGPLSQGRLLAAGMADALAKHYESQASTQGQPTDGLTDTALGIAKRIRETIFEQGPAAQRAAAAGQWTSVVEELVMTNIAWAGLVSGLGGERCRAVAAHALSNALTQVLPPRRFLHGETVGYGILLQLALEQKPEELRALAVLFETLGLPTTLQNLGLADSARRLLPQVFRAAMDPKETLRNLPFPVTLEDLTRAVNTVEALVPNLACHGGPRAL